MLLLVLSQLQLNFVSLLLPWIVKFSWSLKFTALLSCTWDSKIIVTLFLDPLFLSLLATYSKVLQYWSRFPSLISCPVKQLWLLLPFLCTWITLSSTTIARDRPLTKLPMTVGTANIKSLASICIVTFDNNVCLAQHAMVIEIIIRISLVDYSLWYIDSEASIPHITTCRWVINSGKIKSCYSSLMASKLFLVIIEYFVMRIVVFLW